MEPDRLLDPLIGALDRALRAVFAPARGLRPVPGGPGTPDYPSRSAGIPPP